MQMLYSRGRIPSPHRLDLRERETQRFCHDCFGICEATSTLWSSPTTKRPSTRDAFLGLSHHALPVNAVIAIADQASTMLLVGVEVRSMTISLDPSFDGPSGLYSQHSLERRRGLSFLIWSDTLSWSDDAA